MTSKKTRKVTDLLTVLSRPGALAILGMAEDGLVAHKGAHLSVEISRRQYYARLSELAKAGLVDKVGGIYMQTRFGTLVWRDYIPRLESAFIGP